MSSNSHDHHSTGKCLCPYCSGSIARGMQTWNEQNVEKCQQLIEKYSSGDEKSLRNIDEILENLNPVQCFDVLDQLSRLHRSDEVEVNFDNLIIKYVERFRDNGGFFLALRQPEDHRKYFLQRLENLLLINVDHQQRLRLNPTDFH